VSGARPSRLCWRVVATVGLPIVNARTTRARRRVRRQWVIERPTEPIGGCAPLPQVTAPEATIATRAAPRRTISASGGRIQISRRLRTESRSMRQGEMGPAQPPVTTVVPGPVELALRKTRAARFWRGRSLREGGRETALFRAEQGRSSLDLGLRSEPG